MSNKYENIEKFRNQLTLNPKFDGATLYAILDRFRTGFIRQNEIYEFMKFKKAHVDLNMARVIFNFFDVERNGCLSYQEFVQGILPWRNYIYKKGHDNLQITLNIQHGYNQEARLVRLLQQIYSNFLAYEQLKNDFVPSNAISVENMFNYIDISEQGFLDHLNLDEFLRKNGEICAQQDIDLFIRFADTKNNKRIDKSELNYALKPQLDLNSANYLISFQDKIKDQTESPHKFQQKNLHYQVDPLYSDEQISPERVVQQENGKEKLEIMKKTVNFDDYEKFEHKPKFKNQINQEVQNQIYEKSMRVYDGGSLSPQRGSPRRTPKIISEEKTQQRAVTPIKLQRIGLQENFQNYSKYNKSAGKSNLKNPKLFNLYFRDYENKKSDLQYENVLKKSAIKQSVSPSNEPNQFKISSPRKNIKVMNQVEQQFLVQYIREMINLDRELDSIREQLQIKSDFAYIDSFIIMDIHELGVLPRQDFENGLIELGVFPTKDELRLLFNRFDNSKNGTITFQEYHRYMSPYHSKIDGVRRKNLLSLQQQGFKVFSIQTQSLIQRLFKNLIMTEVSQERQKQNLFKRPFFNLNEAFNLLDIDQNGIIEMEDFKLLMEENGVYIKRSDMENILKRFDKNMKGFITHQEFIDEFTPLLS